MKHLTVALGTDHRGFELKEFIRKHTTIAQHAITWLDHGCHTSERCDYPPFAQAVCKSILAKKADLGIVICGSGIGVTIAANRFARIYAGVAWQPTIARLAREDDNCNVLALPADFIDQHITIEIISAWLAATFKGGRYADRLASIDR